MKNPFSDLSSTIVAPATAQGVGAIGVIRLSGKDAIVIAEKVFSGKKLTAQKSHTIHYGFIVNKQGENVDEVMVSLFHAPKSFTMENVVEISTHGSPFVMNKIIETLVEAGARMAKVGEFTMRAFMNGRINLVQAEAVADIIHSENEAQQRIALQQMRGGYSADLQALRQQLIDYLALLELELDFSEEDVEFAHRDRLFALVHEIQTVIEPLIQSFKSGNAIKAGVPIVIAGKPNAGKSTLLNALLNEERAIVSDIAGTTRDTIEEVMHHNGIAFRFIDTAGLRESGDTIEQIGVAKAFAKMKLAQIVIYLFDVNTTSVEDLQNELNALKVADALVIPVANKTELLTSTTLSEQFRAIPNIHFISALQKNGIEDLKHTLFGSVKIDPSGSIVTNLRHYEALLKTNEVLNEVITAFDNKLGGELLAFHLREALNELGSITGEVSNEEVLGSIFSRFCIGK
ncbi:MAG TPA: tRNA uridine-5-carboxymethylaminomethyl(34) synthesis GTPase MnmE [Chitinophagales bacterium]